MTDSENLERIPASAFEGVTDPDSELALRCAICGSTNTRVMSMADAFKKNRDMLVDENTFLIPGRAWGYIECGVCEQAARNHKMLPPKPWYKKLFSQ